ncbi:uncharacterized protein LOC122250667 isoform X2 [Penaeus japonicus]|uniref:uncharacterized protein LOC122250667 isoform X2 n=1 Tax=Penaeus japonicus TaxID=27405 RepID=UPI001C7148B2|nr:uncharacterized protein LOC122250667 isoform X2 [Penaeus japonicus]
MRVAGTRGKRRVVSLLLVLLLAHLLLLLLLLLLLRPDPQPPLPPPADQAPPPLPHTRIEGTPSRRDSPCEGVGEGHPRAWQPVYTVVIDAGATATRLHIYSFLRCCIDNTFLLQKEDYFQVDDSLMNYVYTSHQIRELLLPLLRSARGLVPPKYLQHTPLLLRATPSLRLLPRIHATRLIHRARTIVSRSPFLVKNDHVTIMAGHDEAADLWLAANFLTGRLYENHTSPFAVAELGGGTLRVTVPLDGPPEHIRKAIEERKKQKKAQEEKGRGKEKGAGTGGGGGGRSEGVSARGKTQEEQSDVVVGKQTESEAVDGHGGPRLRGRRKYVFHNKTKGSLSSVSRSKHNGTREVSGIGEDTIPKSIKTSKPSVTNNGHQTVTFNSSVVPGMKNSLERSHSRRKTKVTVGAVTETSAVPGKTDSVASGEGEEEEAGGGEQEGKVLGREGEGLGDSESGGLSVLSGGRRGTRGHDDKERKERKKPDKGGEINIHQDRSSGDGGASLARVPKEGLEPDNQEAITTIAPRGRKDDKKGGREDIKSNSERRSQSNRNKKKPTRRKSSQRQSRNDGGDEARPPGRETPAQTPAKGDTQNPEDEKRVGSSRRVDLGSNDDIRGVEPGSRADQPGSHRITNAGSAEASDGLGDDATPQGTFHLGPEKSRSSSSPREKKRTRSRGEKGRAKTRPRKTPSSERGLLSADALDSKSDRSASSAIHEDGTEGDGGRMKQYKQEKEGGSVDKTEKHKNSHVRNEKTKKKKRRKKPKVSHSRKRRKYRNRGNGMTTTDRATSVPDDPQKTKTDRERIANMASDEYENPGDISPLNTNRERKMGSKNRSRVENGTAVQESAASPPDEAKGGGNKQNAAERPSSGALFTAARPRSTKGALGPSRRRGKNQSRSTSPSNRKRQSKKRPTPLPPGENIGVSPPPQERLSARDAANPSVAGNRDGNLGAEAGDLGAAAYKQTSSESRRRHRHRHSLYNRQRRLRHRDARREGGRRRGVRGARRKILASYRLRDFLFASRTGSKKFINHERRRRELADTFRNHDSSLWERPLQTASNPYAALFGGEEKLSRIFWHLPESTLTRNSMIQSALGSPEMSKVARQRDARRARRQPRRAATHKQGTLIPQLSAEQEIMLSPAETDLRRIDILSRDCDHVRGSGEGRAMADASLEPTKLIGEERELGKGAGSFPYPSKKGADGNEPEQGDAKEQRTRRELRNLFGAPNITYRCSPFHKHWLFTSSIPMGIYPVRVRVLQTGNLTRIPYSAEEEGVASESSTTQAPPIATTPRHRSDIPPEEEYTGGEDEPTPPPDNSPSSAPHPTPRPSSTPPSHTVTPIHPRAATVINSKWMEETLTKVKKVVDSVLRSIGQVNTTLPTDDEQAGEEANSTARSETSWRSRQRGEGGGEGLRGRGGRGERRRVGVGGERNTEEEEGGEKRAEGEEEGERRAVEEEGGERREVEEEGKIGGNGGGFTRIPGRNSTQEGTKKETNKGKEGEGAGRSGIGRVRGRGGRRRIPGRKGNRGRVGGRWKEGARRQIDKAESGGKTNGVAVSGARADNNSSDGEGLRLSERENTRTSRSKAQDISGREGSSERAHRGRGDVSIDDTIDYANLMQNDDTGSAILPDSKRTPLYDSKCGATECKTQNTASGKSKRATIPQNMTSDTKTTIDGTSHHKTPAPNSTNFTSESSGSDTTNQDKKSLETPASSSKQTISSVTDLLFVVPNEIVINPAENSKVQSEIKSTEKLIRTSLEDLFFRVPVDSNRQSPPEGTESGASQGSDIPEVNTEPSVATTLHELTRPNASVASVTSTTDRTPTQFQDETTSQNTQTPHGDSESSSENRTESAAKDAKENGERRLPMDTTENEKSKSDSINRQDKLVLRTACLPIGSLGKFKVQDTTYQVKGMGAGHIAAECWREVSNVVNDHIKLPYLDKTTLVATTAFYFIAASANLIEPEMTYGYVRVEQFRQAADTMCESGEEQFPDPLACLDYQYAAALLTHGLHLSDETEILVCDKIQGFRLGWALGAALNYLQRH